MSPSLFLCLWLIAQTKPCENFSAFIYKLCVCQCIEERTENAIYDAIVFGLSVAKITPKMGKISLNLNVRQFHGEFYAEIPLEGSWFSEYVAHCGI